MAATRRANVGSERIAIVGAGLMGHGLAQVFAQAGHPVAIHDSVPAALESIRQRVAANLASLGADPGAVELITPHVDLASAVGDADLVIEAVPEDLGLKQALFESLEQLAPADAILATNTSVIPVGQVGARVSRGERVLGTHWWNPPYLIPLVEVVQADRTSIETVQRTMALLERAGKQPVHVRRDVPGFVGNRLQHALWREAIAIVAAGVCDAETVDKVVTSGFGRRLGVMGPLETADLIGLDLTLAIHEHVLADLDRTPGPSPYLRELVERGDLGMKTGNGFRAWPPTASADARERLLRHLSA